MSKPINDGGPAFPNEGGLHSGLHAHPGMSLYAYFAGQALAGMNLNQVIMEAKAKGLSVDQVAVSVCSTCWKFADVMLAGHDAGGKQ